MGWESFGVVGFDLGPLLQGQTGIAKLKSAYNSLIIGPRGLGWIGFDLWPLFQGQMRIAKISVYILLIRIPRGLQCHTNL